MDFGDTSVLSLLRESMGFLSERQRVLAQNVANADTPGYTPGDLSQADFQRALSREMRGSTSAGAVAVMTTQPGHITPAGNGGRTYSVVRSADTETTVNGNSVNLEDQMVRAQDNRMRYETAMSLYQKSLSIMRMAARPAGR
tara:strand:- start:368 stop:793 length:426 start_codon:yes stop_codon:yes gene_type:complete